MITIKIQCACGQKYAFDVEPLEGRMPQAIKCPICGADGTTAANEIIARELASQVPPPRPTVRNRVAATAAPAISSRPDSPTAKRGAKTGIIAAAVVGALALLLAAGGFEWWHMTGNRRAATVVATPLPAGLPNTLMEVNAWYGEPPIGHNAATFYQQGFDALTITDQERNSPALPFLGKGTMPALDAKLPDATRKAIDHVTGQNRMALQCFESGFKYPESRYALDFMQGADMKLPHLAKVKQATQLEALVAIAEAERGDAGKACGGIAGVFKIGNSLKSEPLLISQFVRIACFGIGVSTLEQVVNRVQLPPDALAGLDAILKDAETAGTGGEPLTRALIGERAVCLSHFSHPAADYEEFFKNAATAPDNNLPKNFNVAEQIASLPAQRAFCEESFNHFLSLRQPSLQDSLSERLKPGAYSALRVSLAVTNKFYLCQMLMPALGNSAKKEVKGLATLRLGETAVALERFRGARQNAYPDSLAELCPDFLPHIPKDPFDGQPLRYHRAATGYKLYSVGQNLRDEGGLRGASGEGNIVFEVVHAVGQLIDAPKQAGANNQPANPDLQAQLRELKALYDQGKMDKQTYEQKKSAILQSL